MFLRCGGVRRLLKTGAHIRSFRSSIHALRPQFNEASSPISAGTVATRMRLVDGRSSNLMFHRAFSTEPKPAEANSTAEADSKPAEVEHQKSLEDFQHEEIVGPTVEKDESTAANELRECLDKMMDYVFKMKLSLVVMGVMQTISAYWYGVGDGSDNLFFWFSALSIGVTLQLAYLLHQTMKPVKFFQKIEERSRMRILTLSLQVIKAMSNYLSRANVVVTAALLAMLVSIMYELKPYATYLNPNSKI